MSREQRRILLQAHREACQVYDDQTLTFHERLFLHSNTVPRSVEIFSDKLVTERDVIDLCKQRLQRERSEWNSYCSKSWNSHFLRSVKSRSMDLYKTLVGRSFKLCWYEQADAVLFRSDTRGYQYIFKHGFQPWTPMKGTLVREKYGEQYTREYGISTTTRQCYAENWGELSDHYMIRVKGEMDPRIMAVDIVGTGNERNLSTDDIRFNVSEVNIITGIPGTLISGYVNTRGQFIQNSKWTGKLPAPAPARALVPVDRGETKDNSFDDDSDWVMVEPEDRATLRGPPTAKLQISSYVPGTKVTIGEYQFDCYVGKSRQAHLVFEHQDSVKRFIESQDLRAESDPSKLKRPDPKRYAGLFALRLTKERYTELKRSYSASLPPYDDLPLAPAFKR